MARSQPQRSDERLPSRSGSSQLSLAGAPLAAPLDAVWLTACAWCTRIRVDDSWLEASAALAAIGETELSLTHGICPSCFDSVRARADSERLSPAAQSV